MDDHHQAVTPPGMADSNMAAHFIASNMDTQNNFPSFPSDVDQHRSYITQRTPRLFKTDRHFPDKDFEYGTPSHITRNLDDVPEAPAQKEQFLLLKPLFMDLIAMHQDLSRLINDMRAREASAFSYGTVKNMESFQETIEDILLRYGVETFSTEGNLFLSKWQRVVSVIPTSDPVLHMYIARRVRKGFSYQGQVLSPEVVVVYTVDKK